MKRPSNKILFAVLVALTGVFALSKILRAPRREGNLRKTLIELDSTAITEIRVSRLHEKEVRLIRKANGAAWQVRQENRTFKADSAIAQAALRAACNISIRGLASRQREQWSKFNVGDSAATRVALYTGNQKQAEFIIGKVGFAESARSMYTYVRRIDEDDTYSTEDFIMGYFSKAFNDWRDKTLLRLSKEHLSKVAFHYTDSSFMLEQKGRQWYAGSQPADSAQVDRYLSRLERQTMSEFEDAFVPPAGGAAPISLAITISGKSLVTLRAWVQGADQTLVSSAQPGVYFKDRSGSLAKQLFVGKGFFLKQ